MSYFSEKIEFRLTRPHTQHPSLHFTIPKSFLSSTSSTSSCSPYLLLPLPPSIFLDPFSFAPPSSTIPEGIDRIHLLGPTELEKPVGWSLSKQPADDNGDSDPLHREHTAVLAKLSTIQQRENGKNREDGIREVRVRSPWDEELEERKQSEEIQDFGIPLHARYLPPQPFIKSTKGSETPPLSANASVLEHVRHHTEKMVKPVKPLWEGLTRSAFKDGNYQRVQLDVPSFFWACKNDGEAWDMLDEVQKVASVGWDLTDTSSILPASHQHLLPLLTSRLPSHPYPKASLLQPIPPIPSALQLNTLSTRLPVGDSQLHEMVQGITALVILIGAAWCILLTGKSIRRVDRAEKLG